MRNLKTSSFGKVQFNQLTYRRNIFRRAPRKPKFFLVNFWIVKHFASYKKSEILKFEPKWLQIFNLTPNPIFFSRNDPQVLLIILSYRLRKLIQSVIFDEINLWKPKSALKPEVL